LVRDEEGSEFDSLETAVQGAITSAGEIGRSLLAKGNTSDIVIEVRDEHDRQVFTVTASMKIERHDPLPQGPHPWSA
jgi:uncharacterized protein DUF6894